MHQELLELDLELHSKLELRSEKVWLLENSWLETASH